jgi:hypothetical protein
MRKRGDERHQSRKSRSMSAKPDIIVIVSDSLRQDHVSYYNTSGTHLEFRVITESINV